MSEGAIDSNPYTTSIAEKTDKRNAGSENEEKGGSAAITIAIVAIVLAVFGAVIVYCIMRHKKSEDVSFNDIVEQKTYSGIPVKEIKIEDCPE